MGAERVEVIDDSVRREVEGRLAIAEPYEDDGHGGGVRGPHIDLAVPDHDGAGRVPAGCRDHPARGAGSGLPTAKVSRPAMP